MALYTHNYWRKRSIPTSSVFITPNSLCTHIRNYWSGYGPESSVHFISLFVFLFLVQSDMESLQTYPFLESSLTIGLLRFCTICSWVPMSGCTTHLRRISSMLWGKWPKSRSIWMSRVTHRGLFPFTEIPLISPIPSSVDSSISRSGLWDLTGVSFPFRQRRTPLWEFRSSLRGTKPTSHFS